MKKLVRNVFLFAGLLSTAIPAFAQLTDAEKAAKRDELETYFSTALAKTQSKSEAYQVFRLTAHGSSRIGYDSNVDLDQNEDGDMFYEEKAGLDAVYAPEGFGIGPFPAIFGARGRYSYLGYFDRDDMNRHGFLAAPYVRLDLSEALRFESAYEFRGRLYDDRDELNYLSNGVYTTISHRITPNLSHRFGFKFEDRDYDSDRKAVLHNGRPGPDDREDERYEFTYGGKYKAGPWTFSLEGEWVLNDSNDDYIDFNDYTDAGVNGAVSLRATNRIILSGFGGYHFREYASRAPVPAFSPEQEDDWYYVGGRAFYSINLWSGVDVTFTYYDNDSNDSNHDYDGYLLSAGYHLYF